MEAFLSDELKFALEADELGELDKIIRTRSKDHFESLQKLLSIDEPAINKEYRKRALYALGRWEDPSAVKNIEKILGELDESARITAIDALGRLGTKKALKIIPKYSKDPSPHVRKIVVSSLSRIGNSEALSKLRTIANEDSEDWVRVMAAKQLKKRSNK